MTEPEFAGPEGRLAHLGAMSEDLGVALAEACVHEGVTPMPQGRNRLSLPEGPRAEVNRAAGDSVARVPEVEPRA